MLSSLNRLQARKDLLIDITADERIETREVGDFVAIQQELERLSIAVETLQLWAEQKISAGEIDLEAYRKATEETADT